ncbi:hypothetical protein [Vibrio alginolyticus]|uniref:hypothetical protein n=1 Tax=Vibrio alginolyticus TaxID=663 RepID=UPI0015F626C1|nr:hypothetical protein [Vibrio alginolyticus]
MEFVTGALIGGVLYDLAKSGLKWTSTYIKAALVEEIKLQESDACLLAEELSKDEYSELTSKDSLVAKIESSTTIQEMLKRVNEQPKTVINVNHFGTGDAFAGDKIMGNKIIENDE